ncbi:uncharacterized protein EDB91DRAFT_1344627 [Suillus paluster]|uniref:uncharacterized protein n=1 Tax=Suillus paluster TaxID=48578 RepID=UPI001B86D611|nr:uncharacterized protein EDB91DRAFT_1344627 [Suillus paluster]KAG1748900.1 hypothetical protein EDB91DRAFT_1344627 [Suillus paluster]
MKSKAGFLSLAEELQFYILSFLPYRDILHCTSVCKALRKTYTSSSELQYIVELSGQQLLPVPDSDARTPISKRLKLLRDKTHAWFKFDIHSFETIPVPEEQLSNHKIVTDGHLHSWARTRGGDGHSLATIFPILPKPSQQTIERNWSIGALCPLPHAVSLDVFMDPAQNLIAVLYHDDIGVLLNANETLYIDLRALDSGSAHPQAAGQALFLSAVPGYEYPPINTSYSIRKLKGFGRHIALLHSLLFEVDDDEFGSVHVWQLQIWDWKHSMTSSSILSDTLSLDFPNPIDFCFLGDNRLLVVTDDLKLYSIDDMSQTPQLLACFLSPFPFPSVECLLPMDDIEHSSQPQMQVQQAMYTSDPKHRLLCLIAGYPDPRQVYIISTKIFFNLDATASTTPIPWNHWGPSNIRIFQHLYDCPIVHVSENRVLQAFTTPGTGFTEYTLHLMDFSPLAVTNRRGLGRVVKESSTIDIGGFPGRSWKHLTMSLPYVEVVSDRKFRRDELENIWIDNDRIYLLKRSWRRRFTQSLNYHLEVIDI